MPHNYNTRSKGPVPKTNKSGMRDPPPDQVDQLDDPLTIYIDDIFKKSREHQGTNPAMYLINMLTGMANTELHQRAARADIVRQHRRKKKDDESLMILEESDIVTVNDTVNDDDNDDDDDDEDEGVSLESLIKNKDNITTFLNQTIGHNILDDPLEDYDEYDEEYCDLWENETMDMEDVEWQFFQELEKGEKKSFLKQFNEIKKLSATKPIRFKIVESKLPTAIKCVAMQKVMSISQMDKTSGEYFKSEQWLSTLMSVPFGTYEPFPVDVSSPKEEIAGFLGNLSTKMTEAIYGHNEAKCQILQMVGQSIRNPNAAGNVLAIQGPMGNGKTTLVKEGIAKALGRPFAFIALGGATDASFFDGHNFTYEGSRWGKIVDVLIQSKCMNPIFYFDELDKVSDTNKGQEIIHLLTHLTDSSQNSAFNDNYFTGVDFDLSKALFIFSFNDESSVDPILKDRMTVINTDGFDTKEKKKIANEYLLPEIYREYNIKPEDITFSDEIINSIIELYTGEEKGVRNLKRCLYNIVSKINIWTMIADSEKKDIPFDLKTIEYPYKVTDETCNTLLKSKKKNSMSHMYL